MTHFVLAHALRRGCSPKPKLKLENTVSKSVSLELGNGLVQMTLSIQLPACGMVKLARPARSVR